MAAVLVFAGAGGLRFRARACGVRCRTESNTGPADNRLDRGRTLLASIAGEGIADRQLKAFVADPKNKGKVAETGLWAYSRHPNYFFEWLGWFAYLLIAFDAGWNYLWWPLALLAPAMMYWLLVHASGIPPLEEHMLRSRGEKFRAYQERVNAFFPGPRREKAAPKRKQTRKARKS